jgi:hypothetical protein
MRMKRKWLLTVALIGAVSLVSTSAYAVPATGSFGWGFGANDPSGPFMTGYSDTGAYQENVYSGGGAIKTNTWQTLSYTVNNIHGNGDTSPAPTITVSIGGSPDSTSNYGTVITPTDIFLAFGQSVNAGDVPFPVPIYVRDLEFKLDGTTVASEPMAYPSGTNLLDGTHPTWSDATSTGIPLFVQTAPGGFQAAAITDAHGFSSSWTIPDWTFPAISQAQFNAANSMTFSLQVYWSTPPTLTPEPSSFVLVGMAGLALVCVARRKR